MLAIGNQLKAARALVGIDQADLARRARLSVNTIRNMEATGPAPISGRAQNVAAIVEIFEGLGVEFLSYGGRGVRLIEGPAPDRARWHGIS